MQILKPAGTDNDLILAKNASVTIRADNLVLFIRRDSYGGFVCITATQPGDDADAAPYRHFAVPFPKEEPETLDSVTDRACNVILNGGKL